MNATVNTTAAATTVAAVAKTPTGMDIAKQIYAEVNAEGYVLPEGAKSIRQAFIQRAISEGGLTKNGASTYYQNLQNAANGKKLYSYTPKKKVAAEVPNAGEVFTAPKAEGSEDGDAEAAPEVAAETSETVEA